MISIDDVFSEDFDKSYLLQVPPENEEAQVEKPTEIKAQNEKTNKSFFCGKLMMSEWLTKKPDDLENWKVKLCPEGKRHLVVAYQNHTTSYDKKGKIKEKFYSVFPGGNKDAVNVHIFTILDCIFIDNAKELNRCYFVLDVLAWNYVSCRQLNVEDRYFWLKSKFNEEVNGRKLFEITGEKHTYPFYCLETFDFDELKERLGESYTSPWGNNISLDGVLFYRKNAPYELGVNSCVQWLRPFMIQEKLGIFVDRTLQPNSHYLGMDRYLQTLEKRRREAIKEKNYRKHIQQKRY